MEPVQAVVLGIVQGLTEFLPVSSSGHLVIFQHLFGLKETELVFDVAVHVGTLIAVVIYFKKDLAAIIAALVKMTGRLTRGQAKLTDAWSDPDVKLALLIVLSSIPTALIGLGFHQVADRIFSSVRMVGLMLLVTGAVIWATRWMEKNRSRRQAFFRRESLDSGIRAGVGDFTRHLPLRFYHCGGAVFRIEARSGRPILFFTVASRYQRRGIAGGKGCFPWR